MRMDLSCPAEIFRVGLPMADLPAASLLMFNLSDRVIVSAEVTCRLLEEDGSEAEKLVYRGRALNGRPHSTFSMNVPCTPKAGIRKAEVTIEKVWFADNAVWRRVPGQGTEFIPNNLPVSQGLTHLKYIAGEIAVGYPSQQDGLWVCVCGRPNPDSETVCARCRQSKEMVFTRFNREAVEKQISQKERQLELQSRSVREDTARLQREREADYNRRKDLKKRRVLLLAAFLAAVVCVGLALAGGAPLVRLHAARQGMEAGDLEGARETLARLGSFPGAEDTLQECQYRIARQAAEESRDVKTLIVAAEMLRQDANREGTETLARLADRRRAEMLMEAGDFRGAREALAGLAGDPEAEEIEKEIQYREALADMQQKYYLPAREAFLALGDYRDSRSLADECLYLPALAQIENGEYERALYQLKMIPDYQDSAVLILKCRYLQGLTLEKEGEKEAAAEAYFAAGDYEDAAEKAVQLTYQLAEEAFARADFSNAKAYYEKIPEYEDSLEKYRASVYMLAKRAINDMEYRRALQLLALLPEDYEDVTELIAAAATPTPEPTETPEPTPEPTEAPEPTETPTPTGTPEPTETPALTGTPKTTGTPTPTITSATTETPTSAGTPKATETSKPTSTPTAAVTPSPVPTGTPEGSPDPYLVQDDE